MPALKAGQTSVGHIKNAASMNIQETGRLLLSILLFFDQLLHFLLGLCGTLWHIVAHCGTLWHVHICSLLGFKIRTSNFPAGNLAWECPTVATLMCITWNSTPCLPQPILRMSQHLLIFFQILGQDFQILQNNSTTSLWLRFKQSPLFNSYEYCKHGVTKKSCMATVLWKHMINLRCFFMRAMTAIMMMHHTETPGQPQGQHQSEALPGAPADFSFSCSWSAASCLQWQRKLLVWKKWCLRQLSYLYLWLFMYTYVACRPLTSFDTSKKAYVVCKC